MKKNNRFISLAMLWLGIFETAFLLLAVMYFFEGDIQLLISDIGSLFIYSGNRKMLILMGIFLVFPGILLTCLHCFNLFASWKISVLKKSVEFKLPVTGKKLKVLFSMISLLTILSLTTIWFFDSEAYSYDAAFAHALGGIDGCDYTNSKEALEANYAKGFKTFEVDLRLTNDDKLVCRHEWDDGYQSYPKQVDVPNYEMFISTKILDRYTPMDFNMLLDFLSEHKDVMLVTDTKYTDEETVKKQFAILESCVANYPNAEQLRKQIIIQIYNKSMLQWVEDATDSKYGNYLFTMYQVWNGDSIEAYVDICRFCKKNGISNIAMDFYLVNEKEIEIANRFGINVYEHTDNNIERIRKFIDMGVYGIYTDSVNPNVIEEIKNEVLH